MRALIACCTAVATALTLSAAATAGEKDCELLKMERPIAKMMRRPHIELRTFNSLPQVADAAGAVRYAADERSDTPLATQDRIALDAAVERLNSPRRLLIGVCRGDPEGKNGKEVPALGSCDSHYYRDASGVWQPISGNLGSSLAALANTAENRAASYHYQMLQAIQACATNDTEGAVGFFQAASEAAATADTRPARGMGLLAVVESAMLQKTQIVGTRKKLGRKQLDRLTAMLEDHSRKRCDIVQDGTPLQIYSGNDVSVPVARGYNKNGYVRLRFDVDARGIPEDVTIVD
ncbi:MAG: hypothetical protein AAF184_14525, partial [Pseudomonadota bacterium]